MVEPQALHLSASEWVPNNPWLPVLVYRQAFPPRGDTASTMETAFARNGWPAQWRNGIYPYHHYHTTAHEVLGVAAGGTDVLLGGPGGVSLTITAGDVLVVPAGTGHCNLTPDRPLLIVGAYPAGQSWDTRRDALPPDAIERMRLVPFPASDPVSGIDGALPRLWHPVQTPTG